MKEKEKRGMRREEGSSMFCVIHLNVCLDLPRVSPVEAFPHICVQDLGEYFVFPHSKVMSFLFISVWDRTDEYVPVIYVHVAPA